MGGKIHLSAPINEAVNLIYALDKPGLAELKAGLQTLGPELKPGIVAGPPTEDETREYLQDKAAVIFKAFDVASNLANDASGNLLSKIKTANRIKLTIQILTILSSATVLGSVFTNQEIVSKIVAFITVCISVIGLLSERMEKLLSPNSGNIYDAYDKLVKAIVSLRTIKVDLELAVKHQRPTEELQGLIGSANGVLEVINTLMPQVA